MSLTPEQLTDIMGECPELVAQYQLLAEQICLKLGDARAYVDGEITTVNARIDAIADDSDLLARLTALSELVETLDLDGDGSIAGELVGFQNSINALTLRIQSLEVKSNTQSAQIEATNTRLTNYVDSTNTVINNIQAGLSEAANNSGTALNQANTANAKANDAASTAAGAQAKANQNRVDIDVLLERVDGFLGSDAVDQLMNEAECRARSAVGRGLVAFGERLMSCSAFPPAPVTPAASGDGEATVI